MAPDGSVLAKKSSLDVSHQIDPSQTLRAATALLKKVQSDQAARNATSKANLLADAEDDDAEDDIPVWLILTTKKHIIDKKRLKPGKIILPHAYLDTASPNLRICLITADPQRKYKDMIAEPSFPLELSRRIGRVISLTKLKAKYKSFESRRQLYSEYDVFLADDRITTYLPQVLGKVFYKGGSKRPIPVALEGKRQSVDEQGNKRRKLSEGGSKVTKSEVKPTDVAKDIERTLSSALVHLAPSTTTAVKVGKSSMQPQQLQDNIETVTASLVDKYVPQKWRNVKSIHIKGPETAALPIWLAEELWENEADVLEEPLPVKETKKSKKRKRGALEAAATLDGEGEEVLVVPGADGVLRRVEKPAAKAKGELEADAAERAEKAARKEALKKQKAVAKGVVNGVKENAKVKAAQNGEVKGRKTRVKAAEMI